MSNTPDASPPGTEPPTGRPADLVDPVDPARRRRLLIVLATLAVVVLVVDQLTKVWAEGNLIPGERTPLVGRLLGLSLLHNPGGALSIATGMTWVLTLVATTVVVIVVRASRRIGSTAWALALGLLLGGALGNLVDRFFRAPGPARGQVVDFIAYGNVFVGNIADIAIVGAAGLVIVLALRGIGLNGSRESDASRAAEPPTAPNESESDRG
ncbi:signal peptidase II [Pengzhenrongella sp.]|jgi:signal peptidase II|uniref:signal peptidase II n=1 Tax=Pengzhenrongella sp. TaxID=2888820 RepID=UPI002F921A5C